MSLPASGSQVHMLQEMFPDVPDTVIKQVALQEPLLEVNINFSWQYFLPFRNVYLGCLSTRRVKKK